MALIDLILEPTVFTGLTVVIVVLAAVFVLRRRGGSISRKKITVFQPRDKRCFDLSISEETDDWLICRKLGNQSFERRFLKIGSGWSYLTGNVLFLGLEGKGYTTLLTEDKEEKRVELPGILKSLWGPEGYNKMPDDLRNAVETAKFGITISPEPLPDDEEFNISSENLDKEHIKDAMDVLGKKLRQRQKLDKSTLFFGFIAGALAIYILCNMHIIPVVGVA